MTDDVPNSNPFDGFAGTPTMRLYRGAPGPWIYIHAGGAAIGPIPINITDYYIASCLFNGVGSQFRMNGGNLATGNVGANDGDGIRVGEEPFQGDIAEVIVYNTTLSAVNRQRVEFYLAQKYGITLV